MSLMFCNCGWYESKGTFRYWAIVYNLVCSFTHRTKTRDKEKHNWYLHLISGNCALSVTYGINCKSRLIDLQGFDITKCLPYDMHTIFKGVAGQHLNLLLQYLIDSQHYFTLSQLNSLLKWYAYGYSEMDTKPVCIERDTKTSDFKIKQSGLLHAICGICATCSR